MLGSKYKVVFPYAEKLLAYTQKGATRESAILPAGEYIATLVENPNGPSAGSNWLVFEGTDIGATEEYIINRTVADITALS